METQYYQGRKLVPFWKEEEKKWYVFVFYTGGEIEEVYDNINGQVAFAKAKNYIDGENRKNNFGEI